MKFFTHYLSSYQTHFKQQAEVKPPLPNHLCEKNQDKKGDTKNYKHLDS